MTDRMLAGREPHGRQPQQDGHEPDALQPVPSQHAGREELEPGLMQSQAPSPAPAAANQPISEPDKQQQQDAPQVSALSPAPEPGLLGGFRQRVEELKEMLVTGIWYMAAYLDNWAVRAAAIFAFVLALISLVINLALVPLMNYELMPGWQAAACQITQRQVRLRH